MGALAGLHLFEVVQGSIKMSVLLTAPCNFCGHSQADEFLTLTDLRMNLPGSWKLMKCERCGLLFIDPQPGWEELSAHYPKDYHAYLRKDSKSANFLRGFGLRNRVHSVLRQVTFQNGRLLDVGCATGDFLQEFRTITNWEVEGLEIVPEAAKIARAKGLNVIEKELENADLGESSYDVITLWDVLEHVPNPAATLLLCYGLLKPGGILVLKCPDPAGKEASIFNDSWIGYEAPQHLFGFPKTVLINKLEEIGFSRVNTIQTGSDYSSFFVSLGHWLNKQGRTNLSKFIISATHRLFGRVIAGTIIRPIRWLGIRSSCTYISIKKPQ